MGVDTCHNICVCQLHDLDLAHKPKLILRLGPYLRENILYSWPRGNSYMACGNPRVNSRGCTTRAPYSDFLATTRTVAHKCKSARSREIILLEHYSVYPSPSCRTPQRERKLAVSVIGIAITRYSFENSFFHTPTLLYMLYFRVVHSTFVLSHWAVVNLSLGLTRPPNPFYQWQWLERGEKPPT
jgi:hypothetical protein